MTGRLFQVVVTLVSSTTFGFLLDDDQCIAPAPCYCDSDTVSCGHSLTAVPQFIPPDPRKFAPSITIDLSRNSLNSVPDNAFQTLSSINTTRLSLIMFYNKITSVGHLAFHGIEDVTFEVDLGGNRLTTVPTALSTLRNLNMLKLYDNPITHLDASVMSALASSLTFFMFDMIAFKSWPSELRILHKLSYLSIDNYYLRDHLPVNAFVGLESSLTNLTFFNNYFRRIPSEICQLRNLRSVQFYNSTFGRSFTIAEPCFHNMTGVVDIALDDSQLTSYPDVLHSFPSITQLYIDFNQISSIPTNLITDSNRIIKLGALGNNFTHIPGAVDKMRYLQELDLSQNQIETVETNDLASLTYLKDLRLDQNPIRYIARDAFRNNQIMTHVSILQGKLTVIPEALLDLHHLNFLDLYNNPINCTCAMAYLKTWNSMPAYLGGYCYNPGVLLTYYIQTELPKCH